MNHAAVIALAAALAAVAPAPPRAAAQTGDRELLDALAGAQARREARAKALRLGDEAAEAFLARDYPRAIELFREQIALDADDFVPHYNLACALAQTGSLDEADAMLRRSVELGFSSHTTLTTDPDLAPLRTGDLYRDLVEHWPAVMDARRPAAIERARDWLSRRPREVPMPGLKCDLVSGLDEHATELAATMLSRVAAWTQAELIPGLGDEAALARDAWVLVVLPAKADYDRWAAWTFGAGDGVRDIPGAYEHDLKRLVSRDTGASIRHEFFHALHFRHADRLGQRHPVWIVEGLASLVEDMDPVGDAAAAWKPVPSFRTNLVRKQAERGNLTPAKAIAELEDRVFTTNRPLRRYAEARAIFLFMHQRGILKDWYRIYTTDREHGYHADPSGLPAIAEAFGGTIEDFEAAYAAWARDALPVVAENAGDIGVTLGFELVEADDGAEVRQITAQTKRETGLRFGDVVTAIDGRPTSDVYELYRVLGALTPGQVVALNYRRGSRLGTTTCTVKPLTTPRP